MDELEFIRELVVRLVTNNKGCKLSDLLKSPEWGLFAKTCDFNLINIVDEHIQAGRLIRVIFLITGHGPIVYLFPAGTTIAFKDQNPLSV